MSATIKKLSVEQIFDGSHTKEEIQDWFDGRIPTEDQDDMAQFTDNFMPVILEVLPDFLVSLVGMHNLLDNDPLSIVSAAIETGAYAYRQILQSVDPQAMLAVDKYLAQERAKTE